MDRNNDLEKFLPEFTAFGMKPILNAETVA